MSNMTSSAMRRAHIEMRAICTDITRVHKPAEKCRVRRCEQEQHRQQILKSNASIDDQVATGKGAESNENSIVDEEEPLLLKDRSEDQIRD